jgi:hypothetical protein
MPTAWLLADTATKDNDYKSIFFWSFVLIVLLLIAFGGYSYLKKWMNSADEPMPTGFTLSDMRELHRQGKMSTEEFEQARAKMVAAAKRMTEKMPDITPRRSPTAHSESPEGPE